MVVKQLSVFVENKKGRLASIAKTLAEHSIDIRALSLADTSEFGVLRLIVDKVEEAKLSLRELGVIVKSTHVLAVEMKDTPGSAAEILQLLSDTEIAVEYMYACATPVDGKAVMFLRCDDAEKAEAILSSKGFAGISPRELGQ